MTSENNVRSQCWSDIAWEFKQRRFELRESTENGFFAFLNRGIEQFFGQIFSRRVNALSNTNLIASRHIKRENASL